MSKTQEKFLRDYTPPAFIISRCDLDFIIFNDYVDVVSVLSIERKDESVRDLTLDALDLELLAIYYNGVALDERRYKIEEESFIVKDVDDTFELTVKNRIYPAKNTELEGLYVSGEILCTQCEPEGFRRITPFIDRPDNLTVFRVSITADKERFPVLLSNGNRIEERIVGNKKEVTWEDPFPKPSYLFALVAGDLAKVSDSFTTRSAKTIELNIYTEKGNESRCAFAMESLKKAMRWDEEKYDREYDLDIYNIVAVESFNMGAMENKGLNIFNAAYVLADEKTATDRDFMGIESVIAHEYFHNWTGNRITCRDWFQLTLKEGLTVFRDQCFSADMNSPVVQRIEDVKALRQRQFVEDASSMRHPIQPKSYIAVNNFYTATVYEKGAEVIRMLYTLLGEKKFKKGMDVYFETFDSQAVTVDDFLWAMEQGSGIDLGLFRRWYDQSGTPELVVEESFQEGTLRLTMTQRIPKDTQGNEQKPLYYPLSIALFDPEGTLLHQERLSIRDRRHTFTFGTFAAKPIVSLNRNFSAPIIIRHTQRDVAFLARHESDGFARYEAMESFGIEAIKRFAKTNEIEETFFKTYETALNDSQDGMFQALLLEMPSLVRVLADETEIDVAYFAKAHKDFASVLAKRFSDRFYDLYRRNHDPADTQRTYDAIAKRALKNLALEILAYLKSDDIFSIAKAQYFRSRHMGDKLVALKVLDTVDSSNASEMFEDFYRNYANDSLLLVKYFSILSSLDDETVLGRVKELEKDPAFDKTVPNLVRALYGGFTRNLHRFHQSDGSGYRFVAEKILELDAINPQIAAALANGFSLYDKLRSNRRLMMEEALERVISTQSLSKNTYEIVSKILGK